MKLTTAIDAFIADWWRESRINSPRMDHESIRTTGDIYVDWDIDQLSASLAAMFTDDAEGT